MPIGPTELIIVLLIVIVLFGAKKIPELARGLGQGVKEFRAGTRDDSTTATPDALENKKDS